MLIEAAIDRALTQQQEESGYLSAQPQIGHAT
jgi:hypothetical protein